MKAGQKSPGSRPTLEHHLDHLSSVAEAPEADLIGERQEEYTGQGSMVRIITDRYNHPSAPLEPADLKC